MKAKCWYSDRKKETAYIVYKAFCLTEIFPNRKVWRTLCTEYGGILVFEQSFQVIFTFCLVRTQVFLLLLLFS